MPPPDRNAQAALAVLIILQVVMLAALFAGVPPHPPASVAPFGMAPFLAASLSAATAALILGPTASVTGRTVCALAIATALVSFGPHKIIDPAIGSIWPAVVSAWAAMAMLGAALLRALSVSSRAGDCGATAP
ncbi:MAG: hypothetical protein GY717_08480 [Rhodobacteraceae bacterium]|nr:hypothetical protein [Paracoccaceae bacterium]